MQKKVIIALAIISALTVGYLAFRPSTKPDTKPSDLKNVYNQWKLSYKINVGAAEDDYRYKVFSTNFATIKKHNSLLGKSYKLGLNAFTHLTSEEFTATHLGFKTPKAVSKNTTAVPVKSLKTQVDWTTKMNAVKNQGQCGSCWAFSTVGAIEGLFCATKGQLYNLSEQELVDCSTSYGNQGCNGGLMDYGFQYAIDTKGLATEQDYPYTGVDGTCAAAGKAHFGAITGFTDVTVGSSAALKAALNNAPVSVAIEADTMTFQMYSSGVINDDSCGTQLDHGVVAVGYNDEASTPYYNVRNSWGASWGDNGYVKIGIQDGDGICGIQMAASYPTV